jgi:soluble lytic murein transglycosylase-like protein
MSTCLQASILACALAPGLVAVGPGSARAQSPAEKLRRVHEAARDSLQTERKAASRAIARLNVEAKEALAGWLRRGSGAPPTAPSSQEASEETASPAAKRASGDQKKAQPTGTPSPARRPSGSNPEREASSKKRASAKKKGSSRKKGSEDASSAPAERAAEEAPSTPEADRPSTGNERGEAGREESREASSAVPAPRRRAAAPHRPLIGRYARRRGLPRTLTYAIADAESFFDEDAVSSAGAVGLMQVHPPTGGRLAWEAVHGAPQTPSKEHLTKPENNVRLGTKLLQLLLQEYFGGVEEEHSRQLLATASYNAGAGRVAEGLTRDGSLEAAVKLANRLSPREIYERLRRTAPPETQTYVRRVFQRREHYAPWRGEGEVVYGVPDRASSERASSERASSE